MVSRKTVACEQALLFGRAKRAAREARERRREGRVGGEKGLSAPRGFAARSCVLVRLTSLAQTGELARRLRFCETPL